MRDCSLHNTKVFEQAGCIVQDAQLFPDCTEELDYGMTMQKSLFEKAFGLRTKLTAGNYNQ